jgi:hypothetical protein
MSMGATMDLSSQSTLSKNTTAPSTLSRMRNERANERTQQEFRKEGKGID